MDVLMQYVVGSASAVTAGAASYVAWKARSFIATVDANEARSEKNERYLEGTDHRPGALRRLQAVESEVRTDGGEH